MNEPLDQDALEYGSMMPEQPKAVLCSALVRRLPMLSEYHRELKRRLEKVRDNVWDDTDKRTISLEDLCGVIQFIDTLPELIKDADRLDWLTVNRRPGIVRLSFDGQTISKAEGVRAVIDAAMTPNNRIC